MRNLRGTKEIEKIVNNFLLNVFHIEGFLGTNFSYYPISEKIEYALVVPARDDEEFKAVVADIAPDIKADIFILSLLHEVGHNYTWDDLEDFELQESEVMKGSGNRIDYYYAPDEYAATSWAVDYIRTHKEIVGSFWNNLCPALMRFYQLNNLI